MIKRHGEKGVTLPPSAKSRSKGQLETAMIFGLNLEEAAISNRKRQTNVKTEINSPGMSREASGDGHTFNKKTD